MPEDHHTVTPSGPLRAFIDRVIVPALVARAREEVESRRRAEQRADREPKGTAAAHR